MGGGNILGGIVEMWPWSNSKEKQIINIQKKINNTTKARNNADMDSVKIAQQKIINQLKKRIYLNYGSKLSKRN